MREEYEITRNELGFANAGVLEELDNDPFDFAQDDPERLKGAEG